MDDQTDHFGLSKSVKKKRKMSNSLLKNICGCDAKGWEEMLTLGCCYYGDEIISNLQLSLAVVMVYWWLDMDLKRFR